MPSRSSRPYPVHTKIGRELDRRGLRAIDMTRDALVYPRTVTEYLAGRQRPSTEKMAAISNWLHVAPADLYEDKYPWTHEDQLAKEQREYDARQAAEAVA